MMKYGTRKVSVVFPVHAVKAHGQKRYSYTQFGHGVEVSVQLHILAFCAVESKQSPRCTLTGECRLLFILTYHPTLLRLCNLRV